MAWLIAILTALLRVLVPAAIAGAAPSATDAEPDRETRDRLRAKIRKHWIIVGLVALLFLAGCGVRTVYVPHGTPVRLRETIVDVKVWVKDADGHAVAGRLDLPEGWYALPLDLPKE